MATEKQVKELAKYVYGKEIGHQEGMIAYEIWENHHAIIKIVNDGGGSTDLLCETSKAKLYDKLQTLASYKRQLQV